MPDDKLEKGTVDLAALDAKLRAREDVLVARELSSKPKHDMSSLGAAMRVTADLLGGVVVGVVLGYGASWIWPDLKVVFLAAGFVLGVGIGMYNAWRAANVAFGTAQLKDVQESHQSPRNPAKICTDDLHSSPENSNTEPN